MPGAPGNAAKHDRPGRPPPRGNAGLSLPRYHPGPSAQAQISLAALPPKISPDLTSYTLSGVNGNLAGAPRTPREQHPVRPSLKGIV